MAGVSEQSSSHSTRRRRNDFRSLFSSRFEIAVFTFLFACYLLEEPSQPTTDDEHSTRTAPTLEPRSNDLEQNCLRWFVLLLGVPKPPYIRTQHKIFVPTMYLHDAYILQCTV